MACGDRLAGQLRQAGFRVTPQRNVILQTVAHMGDHLLAQQVYEAARRRLPGLNLATVYRTLDSLHRAGLIDLLSTGDEPLRFALRDEAVPHCHLVCRGCGQVFEVEASAFKRLARTLDTEHAFRADISHLTLSGWCRSCRETETTSPRS
jgi:Fur family ferric uptake transcriptional regulator